MNFVYRFRHEDQAGDYYDNDCCRDGYFFFAHFPNMTPNVARIRIAQMQIIMTVISKSHMVLGRETTSADLGNHRILRQEGLSASSGLTVTIGRGQSGLIETNDGSLEMRETELDVVERSDGRLNVAGTDRVILDRALNGMEAVIDCGRHNID